MFTLSIDTDQMVKELDDIRRNQVPFAMALGMNWTMLDVQEAQREQIDREMTVRNPRFIYQAVKIAPEDRASKTKLTAGMRIEGPRKDPDRGKVLTRHEMGGNRQSASQAPFFIPMLALRRFPEQVISQKMYPSYLGVVTSRVGDSGRFVEPKRSKRGPKGTQHIRGRQRTFVLDPQLGHNVSQRAAGIYQRVGVGRSGIVRIWKYQPTLVLKQKLQFQATFDRVVAERFNTNFTGALAYAMEENRPKGGARVWRAENVPPRRRVGEALP